MSGKGLRGEDRLMDGSHTLSGGVQGRQMDIHEHDMGAKGEDLLNGLRAATGLSDDLIPKAAELCGHM